MLPERLPTPLPPKKMIRSFLLQWVPAPHSKLGVLATCHITCSGMVRCEKGRKQSAWLEQNEKRRSAARKTYLRCWDARNHCCYNHHAKAYVLDRYKQVEEAKGPTKTPPTNS